MDRLAKLLKKQIYHSQEVPPPKALVKIDSQIYFCANNTLVTFDLQSQTSQSEPINLASYNLVPQASPYLLANADTIKTELVLKHCQAVKHVKITQLFTVIVTNDNELSILGCDRVEAYRTECEGVLDVIVAKGTFAVLTPCSVTIFSLLDLTKPLRQVGEFGQSELTCAVFGTELWVYTGTASGEVLVWGEARVLKSIRLH
jgi:hypothetical protein